MLLPPSNKTIRSWQFVNLVKQEVWRLPGSPACLNKEQQLWCESGSATAQGGLWGCQVAAEAVAEVMEEEVRPMVAAAIAAAVAATGQEPRSLQARPPLHRCRDGVLRDVRIIRSP